MISTDFRPSRPSTAGSRPESIACEEVDKLVAVADVGDPARVAGAGLEAGLGGHRRVDLVVAGDFFLELPERDVVLLDPGRAAVAVDLGALEQPRIALVAASITPSAPFLNRSEATAVSSTSIRSWASVAVAP